MPPQGAAGPRPAARDGHYIASAGARGGGRGQRGEAARGRRLEQRSQHAQAQPNPFPKDPLTAIIGGGLAGLVCSHELARRGLRSVVFDTGEHGVGGRLATRTSSDGSLPGAPPGLGLLVFDHAAQYFTAGDPSFRAMVDCWEADGAVGRWEGPLGTLQRGAATPDLQGEPRFVARGGMRQLARYLEGQALRQGRSGKVGSTGGLVEVRRPQWVSDAVHTPEGWRLVGRGRRFQGVFDVVVIAHNGKCANRLTAPMGVPKLHAQLRRLRLSANWVLMAAFKGPVPVPGGLQGAFVRECPVLSWAGNNNAKLGLEGAGRPQCWTLISTHRYGQANKVPQESVPPEVAQRVTQEMLAAFAAALGLASSELPPLVYSRTQLWGAALPLNSPHVPCLFDPTGRVGVCGDWVAGGGSMQAAALSGSALAEQIAAASGRQPDDLANLEVGLAAPLKPVAGEEIGQFPAAHAGGQPHTAQQRQGVRRRGAD